MLHLIGRSFRTNIMGGLDRRVPTLQNSDQLLRRTLEEAEEPVWSIRPSTRICPPLGYLAHTRPYPNSKHAGAFYK